MHLMANEERSPMTDYDGILRQMYELLAPLSREDKQRMLDSIEAGLDVAMPAPDMAVWSCKVGWTPRPALPSGSDLPMRQAVESAYVLLTGDEPEFIFSGWGTRLTEAELAVVEERLPR